MLMKFSAYTTILVLILLGIIISIMVLTIVLAVYAAVKLLKKLLHHPASDKEKQNDELTRMHIEDL